MNSLGFPQDVPLLIFFLVHGEHALSDQKATENVDRRKDQRDEADSRRHEERRQDEVDDAKGRNDTRGLTSNDGAEAACEPWRVRSSILDPLSSILDSSSAKPVR